MEKIHLDKNDDIAVIIEKFLDTAAKEVILVIPRGSHLKESPTSFHLLKREAEGGEKKLRIESIDEDILALARQYKLDASHPLFEGRHGKAAFSDIVPQGEREELPLEHEEQRQVEESHHSPTPSKKSFSLRFKKKDVAAIAPDFSEDDQLEFSEPRPTARRRLVVTGVVFVALLFMGWGFGQYFGRVTVSVAFEKTPWESTLAMMVDKSKDVAEAGSNVIPGVLFTEKKNLVQKFPASGKERVNRKAKAAITIYNAYDSSPQLLVATTRFETPDGKIFRLDSQIKVPGAKIENGKIIPSSIEASVTADQPGEAYNIGPIEKMTIPGFKNTPRFAGFYGSLKGRASGGLVGETAVPTPEDVKNAEAKTKEALLGSLEGTLRSRIPDEFRIIEGASRSEIASLKVDQTTDESGQFSVFGEALLSVMAFRDKDLEYVMSAAAEEGAEHKKLIETKTAFENVKTDFQSGKMSFSLKASGLLTEDFSVSDFQKKVQGQKIDKAREALGQVSGLSNAQIAIFPPWLWSLPQEAERIEVVVE